ncbi:hypothetical protein KAFR_0C04700 [Kazachstania africana CBS 2517]|uniref:Protein ZRG17 n=1 Tax=Kazachstania africana (strain ATCC 22294 / BCRC 22015 / CBS 2517 / CECT 1963 / NBRC 1671 / NRRL Y-8276) TaxID=1071382 RepID=H2ASW1_KAZAF|nr:hypothetical protein KAFR_0C04700 [Kazachstania africana CBS 2517]CCF57461.1 hypothetical protein KAFR_0C04700 [Kazachstania africana CBS 2517]
MNAIKEEDDIPGSPENAVFITPYMDTDRNLSSIDLNLAPPSGSQLRPFLASPTFTRANSAFYSNKEGNNSSSSIIYNPSFTFGNSNNNSNTESIPTNASSSKEHRRSVYKYIPESKLPPPPSRSRSPVKNSPSEAIIPPSNHVSKRSSVTLESPFNFPSTTMNDQRTHQQNISVSTTTRTSFRKGHRYKHSSVSMNFFQEPEVKIPLNIAKSLPIPDFNDLLQNLSWPKTHIQLALVLLQIIICSLTFQIGHYKSWSNFITLSHFITYDIIGSLAIICVETLSQFEVWFTATITLPFGLNRIDVLLSFGLAVSLCFVGLDLLFHVLEEVIVLFVENTKIDNHDEINSQIPHSHHMSSSAAADPQSLIANNFSLWYSFLAINLFISTMSLFKIFFSNKHSKLKTKNPIITITYTIYLFFYPTVFETLLDFADYFATVLIALFILIHGLTIVEWTSTILLMGFSTVALPSSLPLIDEEEEINVDSSKDRKKLLNSLPISRDLTKTNRHELFQINKDNNNDATNVKMFLKESIESLEEFKSRCDLNYEDLTIIKVNFSLFIILVKVTLKGGSNDDELKLRLAIHNCARNVLPTCETTIEIDRL